MNDHSQVEAEPGGNQVPFGTLEILAAVAGAERVLDAGCGSGRLTVALAETGAAVTGIDTNVGQLEQARRPRRGGGRRADAPRGRLQRAASLRRRVVRRGDEPPRADGGRRPGRDAQRSSRRVLEPGGRLVTVLWAAPAENPWFAVPREAIGAVLGPERASFARAFGKLGDPEEAAAVHRAAGLVRRRGGSRRGNPHGAGRRRRTGRSCRPRTATSAGSRPP